MSTTNNHTPGNTPPGVDAAAIARGHEADGYHMTSVVSVPLMVIGFFLLAFVVTTAVFWYATKPTADTNAHPAAVERNKAPLNDRLSRIYRGGEVDQPRLEPLVLREPGGETFSRKPLAEGNSPQIHPEALRVSKENTPSLYTAKWVEQGKVARITIDDAMKISLEQGLLKAAKNETRAKASKDTPSAANAGRAAHGEHKH